MLPKRQMLAEKNLSNDSWAVNFFIDILPAFIPVRTYHTMVFQRINNNAMGIEY